MSKIIPTATVVAEFPEVMPWLQARAPHFDFAHSVRTQALHRGGLTQPQIDACLRMIDRSKERRAEEAAKAETAPTVDYALMERVFSNALAKGLRAPRMTIGEYRFSPAKVTGMNPGAIYVKKVQEDGPGEYLGKMMNGKFLARCTEEAMREVLEIACDPLTHATKHGKLTGRCAICSRKLTAEESVGRAIGPVCYEKFFGGL